MCWSFQSISYTLVLLKLQSKYFILFDAIANGKFFLNFIFRSSISFAFTVDTSVLCKVHVYVRGWFASIVLYSVLYS